MTSHAAPHHAKSKTKANAKTRKPAVRKSKAKVAPRRSSYGKKVRLSSVIDE